MSSPRPLLLIILDGWGLSDKKAGNAILQASTPNYSRLLATYPHTQLQASGEAVGLPSGQMGNSEVGHLNIGAGRIVYQELTRISKAIEESTFADNKILRNTMRHVSERGSALHLLGLVSDGGVHSHEEHLFALLRLAKEEGIKKLFVHAILDGRDVSPTSARQYLGNLEEFMRKIDAGKTATVAGRYYTMDRDNRWERIEKAYLSMVKGEGKQAVSSMHALESAYERGETDEFVLPTVILDEQGVPVASVKEEDAVVFFNFRPDRARQITRAFTDYKLHGFPRGDNPPLPRFVCMAEYDKDIRAEVAFPPDYPRNTLGEVIADQGMHQLRIAETEKYAHVTFFFNGGREAPFPYEERILVPSSKVPTYNMQPEMSAPEVTERVLAEIERDKFDFIVLNYANPDMVGHTGILDAAVKAVEEIDKCLQKVVDAALAKGGAVVITSDHGNVEQMTHDMADTPFTAHTSNTVPFILVSSCGYRVCREGILADVAPTVLEILGLPASPEMTGKSLCN